MYEAYLEYIAPLFALGAFFAAWTASYILKKT